MSRYFNTIDEYYELMRRFFGEVVKNEKITRELLKTGMVIRFRYLEPEGEILIDLTGDEPRFDFGKSDRIADVEMTQSVDFSHSFWQGRENIAIAMAGRKIVARGSVTKALKLLPVIKPTFNIYVDTIKKMGKTALLIDRRRKRSLLKRIGVGGLLKKIKRREKRGISSIERRELKSPAPIHGEGDDLIWEVKELPNYRDMNEKELLLSMLKRMLEIRFFEEEVAKGVQSGLIQGMAHLSTGQEAIAVGTCFNLRMSDYIVTSHRGHGHMLAKGADPRRMFAEIAGRVDGLCRGKGGSLHVTCASIGGLGANGIVCAWNPIGVGSALSSKLKGDGRITVTFTGDGATNQGMFHEALNLAAIWNLPILFVIENNGFGVSTRVESHTRVERLAERGRGHGVPGITIDGNDVIKVYDTVKEIVEKIRNGGGPFIIEMLTYRMRGHWEGDPETYRQREEVEEAKKRDPIVLLKNKLLQDRIATDLEIEEVEKEARSLIDDSVEFAKTSPKPEPFECGENIFAKEPPEILVYREVRSMRKRRITFSHAIREAIKEEMERDSTIFLMGEDVSMGFFGVTEGLSKLFPGRVIDTPISEMGFTGAGVGAAMTGTRPLVEIMFSDFLFTCFDMIANQAAKVRYMSGGQYSVPLVIRTPGGGGLSFAAQHSQSLEGLFASIPGLKVAVPSTPEGAKGLLKTALRGRNPVLFFENKLLYFTEGEVPDGEYTIPFGLAKVLKEGRHLTLLAIGGMVHPSLEVAQEVEEEDGIEVEVIDPQTLFPFDMASLLRSLKKTGRLLIVEESCISSGFSNKIIASLCDRFRPLSIPVARISADDAPIPFSPPLEMALLPSPERIKDKVFEVMEM